MHRDRLSSQVAQITGGEMGDTEVKENEEGVFHIDLFVHKIQKCNQKP